MNRELHATRDQLSPCQWLFLVCSFCWLEVLPLTLDFEGQLVLVPKLAFCLLCSAHRQKIYEVPSTKGLNPRCPPCSAGVALSSCLFCFHLLMKQLRQVLSFLFIDRGFKASRVSRARVRDSATCFHGYKMPPGHPVPLEGHSWLL